MPVGDMLHLVMERQLPGLSQGMGICVAWSCTVATPELESWMGLELKLLRTNEIQIWS